METPLTGDSFEHRTPQWSSDGNWIVYVKDDATTKDQIYKVSASGVSETGLTSDSSEHRYPQWSPDGAWIAYVKSGEIYRVSASGGSEILVSVGAGTAYSGPQWSPDGSWIVASRNDAGAKSQIYKVQVIDGAEEQLTTDSYTHYVPQWSPDGTSILYEKDDATVKRQIYKVAASGGSEMALTSDSVMHYEPQWSPDSSWVVYRRQAPSVYQIFKLQADGTNEVQLTSDGYHHFRPEWSPDGNWIAFEKTDATGFSQVYKVPSSGGSQAALTSDAYAHSTPQWSPDSSQVCHRKVDSTGVGQIYVVSSAGPCSPTPTLEPSSTPTNTTTRTPTRTPTASQPPTSTRTPTRTPTATSTNTATMTRTPTRTVTATPTPYPTPFACSQGYVAYDVLVEDFMEGVPEGWLVINNGGCGEWEAHVGSNQTGGTGVYLEANSGGCLPEYFMDTEIWTPIMDLTGMLTPELGFRSDMLWRSNSWNEYFAVDFSLDGGETWNSLLYRDSRSYAGPTVLNLPIPSAAGCPTLRLRFHYGNAVQDFSWQIDDVRVRACNNRVTATPTATKTATPTPTKTSTPTRTATSTPLLCSGDSTRITLLNEGFRVWPLSGWTILNDGGDCVWGQGSVIQPGCINSTGGGGDFAVADSDYCGFGTFVDSELRSPLMNFTGMMGAQLSFWSDMHWWSGGGDEFFDVDLSVNGGNTWTRIYHVEDRDARGPRKITLSLPGSDGRPGVQVRFHYGNASFDYWWAVDEVLVWACTTAMTATPTCTPSVTRTATPSPTSAPTSPKTPTGSPTMTAPPTATATPTRTSTPFPVATSLPTGIPTFVACPEGETGTVIIREDYETWPLSDWKVRVTEGETSWLEDVWSPIEGEGELRWPPLSRQILG